jgi:hypothetical protein
MCTMVYFTATESDKRAVQQALMDVYTELDKNVAYIIATYKRDADYVSVIEQHEKSRRYKGKKNYDWKQILQICGELPEHLIRQYEDVMNFQLLSRQRIPEDVIARHLPPPSSDFQGSKRQIFVNIRALCRVPGQFSDEFMFQHRYELYWPAIRKYNQLSRELQIKLEKAARQKKETLEEAYPENMNWCGTEVLIKFQLPDRYLYRYIQDHGDCTNWTKICIYQALSEEFMEEHADKLDWDEVATYQRMSDAFIMQHHHHLPWRYLHCNRHISAERKAMLKATLYS